MLLDGGKKGIGPLCVGSGIEKRRKVMKGRKKRMMYNVRSLKKKIAYAPNLGPSRKDDQYCVAPYLFSEMRLLPKTRTI